MQQPRSEYPRPELVRDNWLNLNGSWEFETDPGNSGLDRGFAKEHTAFNRKITVPFCIESGLSGIEEKDFAACVWYGKNFVLPENMGDKRIMLHFEAADFETQVWCNGTSVGRHRGGYTPFSMELTDALNQEGENRLVVRCVDNVRSGRQAVGKQSGNFYSQGCHYTRTTGIWQTVWLEAVPSVFITKVRYQTDINTPSVTVTVHLSDYAESCPVTVATAYEGKDTGTDQRHLTGRQLTVTIPLSEKQLWSCGDGRLYTVDIQAGNDHVIGYFGLRDISVSGQKILLNGEPVFQRLVLDQGFYPDGIYTAPSDEALLRDITLSMAAGFNGARLHQKIFERRFLYHADRLGYLVWDEYPSWGLDIHTPGLGLSIMLPEWLEVVERDINHPSLIGWCPLNETFDGQDTALLYALYQATKALDPTRPVIDTSGYVHVITDIYDIHDYDQNPESFGSHYSPAGIEEQQKKTRRGAYTYDGLKPYFVSEYGGIWWNENDPDGWGYGERVEDIEAFYVRLEGLTATLLNNPKITAFCYTQLTDVEQEQNGIYFYNRNEKFDMARIRRIFSQEAAIERKM